jgi:transposase
LSAFFLGASIEDAIDLAGTRLKASHDELRLALDGELCDDRILTLQMTLDSIRELETKITDFELTLLQMFELFQKQLDLLSTIPGLNRIGAVLLLVEIGPDMEASGLLKHIASWAGLCPGNNESAGKRNSCRTRWEPLDSSGLM